MKKEYIESKVWVQHAELTLLDSTSMFDRQDQDDMDVFTDETLEPGQALSRRRNVWGGDDDEEEF